MKFEFFKNKNIIDEIFEKDFLNSPLAFASSQGGFSACCCTTCCTTNSNK